MQSHCCSHGFFRRVLARSSFPLASSAAPTTLWSARRLASSTAVAAPVVDHYARLGVDDAATAADIKAAYRRRALQCHPDVVSEGTKKSAAEAEFRLVSESFQVLSDPSQRATLDEALLKSGRRSKKQAKEKQQARAAKMQAARASGAPTAQSAEDGERVSLRKPPVATPKRHTSSSSSSSAKRRSPFVRRDADRVFEEAFEGKSLQDILFSLEFERRHGNRSSSSRNSTKKAQQQQQQSSAAGGVSDASSSSSSRPKNSPEEGLNRNDSNNNNHHPNTPAGSDEVLRRVLHTAAQQFAANVSRQYGPESLKHAKFIRTKPAAPPPSSKMTFRPFCNWNVPSGVETPATPSLGPVTSSDDPAVEVAKPLRPPKPMKGVMSEEMRNEMQRSSAIHRLHAETNRPHNLGQVYSYHRMY